MDNTFDDQAFVPFDVSPLDFLNLFNFILSNLYKASKVCPQDILPTPFFLSNYLNITVLNKFNNTFFVDIAVMASSGYFALVCQKYYWALAIGDECV